MSLVNNNQVRVLYLQNCGIDDRGAHLIAFALNKNTSVQHLWLNGNTISSSGAAIANILCENCTLLTVGLCDNDIGNSGGREIRSALKENQVITDILLDGNRIKERIVNDIARRCDRSEPDWDASSVDSIASTTNSIEKIDISADVRPRRMSLRRPRRSSLAMIRKMLSSISEET